MQAALSFSRFLSSRFIAFENIVSIKAALSFSRFLSSRFIAFENIVSIKIFCLWFLMYSSH